MENLHASHRERMRQRLLEHGAEAMHDHEILEMLLYYAIPRGDTNPIAHALLHRFGSLSQVLEAPVEELQKVDPDAAQRLHPNDEKRIIRALEVWLSTGKTITQHNLETQAIPPRYTPLIIGLDFEERKHLRRRIDLRVDDMMERGLEQEIRQLLADGVPSHCTAMQAIGYKEIVSALLEGRPVEEGAEEVKLRSRQYAKRQLTWFRRNPAVHWYRWKEIPDFSDALAFSTKLAADSGLQ